LERKVSEFDSKLSKIEEELDAARNRIKELEPTPTITGEKRNSSV